MCVLQAELCRVIRCYVVVVGALVLCENMSSQIADNAQCVHTLSLLQFAAAAFALVSLLLSSAQFS